MSPPATATSTISYAHSSGRPSSLSRRPATRPHAMKFSAKKIPKVFSEMPRTLMSGCTAGNPSCSLVRL